MMKWYQVSNFSRHSSLSLSTNHLPRCGDSQPLTPVGGASSALDFCTECSDLVFAITTGKIKPAKHIFLPFTVKFLTGNAELIHTLNQLEHRISYSQVQALCLQKVELAKDNVTLSVNIHPYMFTTLGWDNIDQLEETISGASTFHRVNGIAVQAKVIGPIQP